MMIDLHIHFLSVFWLVRNKGGNSKSEKAKASDEEKTKNNVSDELGLCPTAILCLAAGTTQLRACGGAFKTLLAFCGLLIAYVWLCVVVFFFHTYSSYVSLRTQDQPVRKIKLHQSTTGMSVNAFFWGSKKMRVKIYILKAVEILDGKGKWSLNTSYAGL